ncbi:MAG: hypothetical protein KGJ80_05760 [Chloroflexota bacterium]|nr:hypothetical protein [Chloroflexota bacterium]
MTWKLFSPLLFAGVVGSAIVLFAFGRAPALAHPSLDATPVGSEFRDPKYLNKGSCPDDPKNLALNGGFFPELHDTQYGPTVNPWQPFVVNGSAPQFRWVNNEGIFKSQSEQILSTNTFDAGIMQTVLGLQSGNYYWFRLGWAPAAKSFDGPNVESLSVGRKVGVDPFGGTDPKSPNVIWGPDYFGDTKGLNRLELIMVFAARAPSSTIFLRAMARDNSGGENRVWFNAVCMEARPELGIAPPLAPTATPAPPTAPATATRPVATRVPATKMPVATNTPPQEVLRAPSTPTPTAVTIIEAAPTLRFARPNATPVPDPLIDPGQGALAGLGSLLVVGGFFSLGLGIVLWRRID